MLLRLRYVGDSLAVEYVSTVYAPSEGIVSGALPHRQ